ncbi:hypothetical protein EV644_104594 [Kribbella orskensis]|uniref:Uncharacterized protein n=1 Tax=Kribbella orskensis TaxID=2512216 RepID=A0ABY2BRA9_9ACTN|nr:hypothetical protein EV642_103594 [Kribbella sp. VKM Ac-2500]TCO26090.1 hypothetical protein EV644_104594 [Kribbella orskensis]
MMMNGGGQDALWIFLALFIWSLAVAAALALGVHLIRSRRPAARPLPSPLDILERRYARERSTGSSSTMPAPGSASTNSSCDPPVERWGEIARGRSSRSAAGAHPAPFPAAWSWGRWAQGTRRRPSNDSMPRRIR